MLYKLLWLFTIAGIRHHCRAEDKFKDYLGMFNDTDLELEDRPKVVARRQHISDFTDAETGKNPFLDLIEGPSGSRGGQSDGLVTPYWRQLDTPVEGVSLPLEGGSEGRRTLIENIRPHQVFTKKANPATQTTLLQNVTKNETVVISTTETSVLEEEEHLSDDGGHYSKVLFIALALSAVVMLAVLVVMVYLLRKRANRFTSNTDFAIGGK